MRPARSSSAGCRYRGTDQGESSESQIRFLRPGYPISTLADALSWFSVASMLRSLVWKLPVLEKADALDSVLSPTEMMPAVYTRPGRMQRLTVRREVMQQFKVSMQRKNRQRPVNLIGREEFQQLVARVSMLAGIAVRRIKQDTFMLDAV